MCCTRCGESGPELSDGGVLLADVYAWRPDDRAVPSDSELSARLKEHLDAADLPAALNRVTFVVAAPDGEGTRHRHVPTR